MFGDVIFRPPWTCGRYCKEKRVALYYNLLEGISYYFEDDSADVVGYILGVKKNGSINISDISKTLDISVESLMPFLQQLEECGLIVARSLSKTDIEEYRQSVFSTRESGSLVVGKNTSFELGHDSEAENAYYEAVQDNCPVVWATLELTYSCSEKCIHCYNAGATRNDEEISKRACSSELTKEELIRVVDELYSMGTVSIALTGGDPFSNINIWELLDYLYIKDFAVTILTNGYAISNCARASKLARYYPKKVQISLYSSDSSIHDAITRVPGSFQKTVSAIELLAKAAVPVTVACCIMKPNLKTYKSVKTLAEKLNVSISYELNITDAIDGDISPSSKLRLDKELYQTVLQDPDMPLCVNSNVPDSLKETVFRDSDNFCGAGDGFFAITPNGTLIPCPAFHLELGNIKNSSIRSIINSNAVKEWQKVTAKDYVECGKHDYCHYCYPCPGNNYTNTGSFNKAGENNCFQAKCRWNIIKRIREGKRTLDETEIDRIIQLEKDYTFPKIKRILKVK